MFNNYWYGTQLYDQSQQFTYEQVDAGQTVINRQWSTKVSFKFGVYTVLSSLFLAESNLR